MIKHEYGAHTFIVSHNPQSPHFLPDIEDTDSCMHVYFDPSSPEGLQRGVRYSLAERTKALPEAKLRAICGGSIRPWGEKLSDLQAAYTLRIPGSNCDLCWNPSFNIVSLLNESSVANHMFEALDICIPACPAASVRSSQGYELRHPTVLVTEGSQARGDSPLSWCRHELNFSTVLLRQTAAVDKSTGVATVYYGRDYLRTYDSVGPAVKCDNAVCVAEVWDLLAKNGLTGDAAIKALLLRSAPLDELTETVVAGLQLGPPTGGGVSEADAAPSNSGPTHRSSGGGTFRPRSSPTRRGPSLVLGAVMLATCSRGTSACAAPLRALPTTAHTPGALTLGLLLALAPPSLAMAWPPKKRSIEPNDGDERWQEYLATIEQFAYFGTHPGYSFEQFLADRYGPASSSTAGSSNAGSSTASSSTAGSREQFQTRKQQRSQAHRENVAHYHRQQDYQEQGEELQQRQRAEQRHRAEQREVQERAQRWSERSDNVPHLPPEVWAHVHQQTLDEEAQLAEWLVWADATLMELVVIWFRTGGHRKPQWLGSLVGKNGGISTSSTDNIGDRFRPWCNSIIHPGQRNTPLHYQLGSAVAPAEFVAIHDHMLVMMQYLGFEEVITRLQRILRLLAKCITPTSNVPRYIPRPPDSDDDEPDWSDNAPTPGAQPRLPPRPHVQQKSDGKQTSSSSSGSSNGRGQWSAASATAIRSPLTVYYMLCNTHTM